MKKILYLVLGLTVTLSSCKKFLDINNDNPNKLTKVNAALVLPQAIAATGELNATYNKTLADIGGQFANSGNANFSTSSIITYSYTSSSITSIWTNTYRNAIDYEYILGISKDDLQFSNTTAIAKIMKSYVFAKLVDQYNDVPYFNALKGNQVLEPKYDDAVEIYKDLVSQLTEAIKLISDGVQLNFTKPGSVDAIKPTVDPMFAGDMELWKRFANTLKLKLLIKMATVPELKAYTNAEFAKFDATVGFISNDAVVNPGYIKESGKQNPTFNSLAFNSEGTRAITTRIPTRWIYAFYDGKKLRDTWRGKVIYRLFPSSIIGQLGNITSSVPVVPLAGNSSWFSGTSYTSNAYGVNKGPSQSQVMMLAAESWFVQAEAYLKNYLSGNAKTAFDNGIAASFTYLYKDVNDVVDPTKVVATDVAAYKTANPTSYLVNWDKTLTPLAADYNKDIPARQLEAIITQKYIALNNIMSDEGFNEFRRTTYPYIVNGSTDPILSFASLESLSSRADKLPSRLLYPAAEISYNEANMPKGINQFLSRIFWDLD